MAAPIVNPHQRYLKTRIETASQPQLLLMIFDAAVKKLHFARTSIEKKQIEKAHTELTKVQRIFTELMVALDFEKGGELANNLIRIYDFIYHQLVQANIKQDTRIIDEVLPIVEDLRDGWTQAVEKFNSDADATEPLTNQAAQPHPVSPAKPAVQPVSPASLKTPPAASQKAEAAKPVPKAKPRPYPAPAASVPAAQEDDEQPRPRLNITG